MDIKKKLALTIIVLTVFGLLTVVSAADVSIESLNFSIPDGYSENTSAADTWNDGLMDHNYKQFNDGDKEISIEVMSIPSGAVITSLDAGDGESEKTIGSASGLISDYDEENQVCFRYIDGDKEVVIYAPDEATLEKIIK